jgi:hypothetical protein
MQLKWTVHIFIKQHIYNNMHVNTNSAITMDDMILRSGFVCFCA